jgi:23S rRNA pseudouridine1911/1915/1917 synthase
MNQQNQQFIIQKHSVMPTDAGLRIDQFLAFKFPEYSRAAIQQWISSNQVLINGKSCKSKNKLKGYEIIEINVSIQSAVEDLPQKMSLDIIFEDDDVLVINKPASLLVHPGAGNPDNTLLNGLLAHNKNQSLLPRAGIVHRLDKMTSGLMVVAKTTLAYNSLVNQLKDHSVARQYFAVVKGRLEGDFVIDQPIGRHKTQRTKMAVVINGKRAVSHVKCLTNYRHYTTVKINLETGRTHQIRVHMHYIGHQLLGDPVYGNPLRVEPKLEEGLKNFIREFPRQALHAQELTFMHPTKQKKLTFKAKIPDDILELIEELNDFDTIKTEDFDNEWEVIYEDD